MTRTATNPYMIRNDPEAYNPPMTTKQEDAAEAWDAGYEADAYRHPGMGNPYTGTPYAADWDNGLEAATEARVAQEAR